MSNAPFLCLVWALTDPPPGIPGGGPMHPGFQLGRGSHPGGGPIIPVQADARSRASGAV